MAELTHTYPAWPAVPACICLLARLDWGYMPPLLRACDNRRVKAMPHSERRNFRIFPSKGSAIGVGTFWVKEPRSSQIPFVPFFSTLKPG